MITGSGAAAVISGGSNNIVKEDYGAVGGGQANIVYAQFGTIPGGSRNRVSGEYSFAAGTASRANHEGSFVWSHFTGVPTDTFATTDSSQFLIRAAGGVGIGTNKPGATLTVFQPGSSIGEGFRLEWESGNDTTRWETYSNGDRDFVWAFQDTDIGCIDHNSGDYMAISDVSAKKDIRYMQSALADVARLRPATYRYKRSPDSAPRVNGFIAQDLEKVFPEMVGEINGTKAVAYSQLTVVSIRAIQELMDRIEDLEATVEALSRRL